MIIVTNTPMMLTRQDGYKYELPLPCVCMCHLSHIWHLLHWQGSFYTAEDAFTLQRILSHCRGCFHIYSLKKCHKPGQGCFIIIGLVGWHRMYPSIFPAMLSGDWWSKQVSTTVALTVQTLYGGGGGARIFVVQANLLLGYSVGVKCSVHLKSSTSKTTCYDETPFFGN